MGGNPDSPINLTNFDPIIEILPMDLSIASSDMHFNMAIGPRAGLNLALPIGNLGFGAGIKLDIIRFDNKLAEYKSKRFPCPLQQRPESKDARGILFRKSNVHRTDVTSACTTPKEEAEEKFDNAFGFTIDLKTGIYAYINMAGFYIDTSWIGNKVGSDFNGLYWGIKNLVARCTDCGNNSCVSEPLNDLFDSAKAKLHMNGTKYHLHELGNSEHVSKDSISSLDDNLLDEDFPTGDPETACYLRMRPAPPPPKDRRGIFAHEDVVFRRAVLEDKKPEPKCKPGGKAKP